MSDHYVNKKRFIPEGLRRKLVGRAKWTVQLLFRMFGLLVSFAALGAAEQFLADRTRPPCLFNLKILKRSKTNCELFLVENLIINTSAGVMLGRGRRD